MWKFFGLTVVATGVLVWGLISHLTVVSVEKAVSRDAVDKALHWGVYMSEHIPDIEHLIEAGTITTDQKAAIREIRQLGDVFRFKLFDESGRLVLISDEDFISNASGIATAPDPEPRQVLLSGIEIVEVFDGTEKLDRPDLYAEAYIPLMAADGRAFGVAEVYIDETMTRQYFSDSFRSFGIFVSGISAFLFLLPATAFRVQRAIAARSRSEAEYLSKFDLLTGLLNRSAFTCRAQSMLDKKLLTSLIFLDADKFKMINDTHGHAAGDAYLERVGRVLAAVTDADDLVARFGGDEFVIAFSEPRDDVVIQRLHTILAQCATPIEVGERTITASVSIGVANRIAGTDLDSILAQADAALYHAKAAGRNQFAFYDNEMGEAIHRKNLVEQRIREATVTQDFSIMYQPLVNGSTQELIGYEALLRLNDIDGTPIPPIDFVPIAEEIGLIDEIGEWTMKEAIRTIVSQPGQPKIAVNLSVLQFRDGRLPDILKEAISETGIAPCRIELEITETLLINDEPGVAFQIDQLQDIGVSIAMDDFGTGFSSLGYLWKYGFDRIKIDQSFVAGLEEGSERSLQIIDTIISLGQRLGMKVTAEGVETEAQSIKLSELGCDVMQGYLFGQPLPMPSADTHRADALIDLTAKGA